MPGIGKSVWRPTASMAEGEDGPLVLPDRLICKFLIVESEAELCLLFGPVKIFTYHAMLLDKYCSDHVIASAWIKPRELLQVLDRRLRVLGGGWMEFQPALELS